jgi:alpha-1,2-mannosyltransferase
MHYPAAFTLIPGVRPGSIRALPGEEGYRVTTTSQDAIDARSIDRLLLVVGVLLVGVVAIMYIGLIRLPGWWMFPVDMTVYRDAGEIVRQVPPTFDPRLASPLYDWPGPPGLIGLVFTYPPFSAMIFAPLSYLSLNTLARLAAVADVLALVAVIWIAFGSLGYRAGVRRASLTLLAASAVFYTEPVERVIYLGQIDLLLAALVVWDLCQPENRWWQGIGVGLAAGIKLVPLIFIPYLLITRRHRQAAVATATFGLTVAAGFAVLPKDSATFWLHGLFLQGSRVGSVDWSGNQSLLAVLTRLGGGANVGHVWLVAAIITVALGLTAAAILHRAGHQMLGLLTCALTGLLVSPISWDHHWVWIVLALPVLVCYGIRLTGLARWACFGLAAVVTAIFGAWPTVLWGETSDQNGWSRGVIWAPPNSGNDEYGWHGWQLIAGNAYVLTGLAMFIALLAMAGWQIVRRHARQPGPGISGRGNSRESYRAVMRSLSNARSVTVVARR